MSIIKKKKYIAKYNDVGPNTIEIEIELSNQDEDLQLALQAFVCIDGLDDHKLKKYPYLETEETLKISSEKSLKVIENKEINYES
tara:strand:- start:738 stop:992 length:255 start_codon:yes stop_codon:yes gene_type:complete